MPAQVNSPAFHRPDSTRSSLRRMAGIAARTGEVAASMQASSARARAQLQMAAAHLSDTHALLQSVAQQLANDGELSVTESMETCDSADERGSHQSAQPATPSVHLLSGSRAASVQPQAHTGTQAQSAAVQRHLSTFLRRPVLPSALPLGAGPGAPSGAGRSERHVQRTQCGSEVVRAADHDSATAQQTLVQVPQPSRPPRLRRRRRLRVVAPSHGHDHGSSDAGDDCEDVVRGRLPVVHMGEQRVGRGIAVQHLTWHRAGGVGSRQRLGFERSNASAGTHTWSPTWNIQQPGALAQQISQQRNYVGSVAACDLQRDNSGQHSTANSLLNPNTSALAGGVWVPPHLASAAVTADNEAPPDRSLRASAPQGFDARAVAIAQRAARILQQADSPPDQPSSHSSTASACGASTFSASVTENSGGAGDDGAHTSPAGSRDGSATSSISTPALLHEDSGAERESGDDGELLRRLLQERRQSSDDAERRIGDVQNSLQVSAPLYEMLRHSTRALLPAHLLTPPAAHPQATGLDGEPHIHTKAIAGPQVPADAATGCVHARTFYGHLVGTPEEVLGCARPPSVAGLREDALIDIVSALPGVDLEHGLVHSVLDALQSRATCCRMALIWSAEPAGVQ